MKQRYVKQHESGASLMVKIITFGGLMVVVFFVLFVLAWAIVGD